MEVEFDENMATKQMERKDESSVATPAMLPISEMQLKISRENPRKEPQVYEWAMDELRRRPDYAEDAYYSIPYKDKKGEEGKKITMVEGLTIKASMALARRWGNCANAARIADEREDRVICQGMMFDYETNMLTLRDYSVSKIFKQKGGGEYRLDANRLNMAILSGQSKAVRNAILASLPTYLKDDYFALAKHIVLNPPTKEGKKVETSAERIEKAKSYFIKEFKATKDEMEKMITEWIADSDGEINEDDILAKLIGLKNALKDGHITIDKALDRATPAGASMPQEISNGEPKTETR